jgi:hypothetical protein
MKIEYIGLAIIAIVVVIDLIRRGVNKTSKSTDVESIDFTSLLRTPSKTAYILIAIIILIIVGINIPVNQLYESYQKISRNSQNEREDPIEKSETISSEKIMLQKELEALKRANNVLNTELLSVKKSRDFLKKKLDGSEKNINEYSEIKPVINILSTSFGALYFNCENKLDVQVPALGTNYNPTFSAKGGSAIKGTTAGAVTIVPNSKEVVLSVSSNGNRIGSRTFGVRPIPAVEIKAFSDRGEVDVSRGIPAATTRLSIRAIPDAGFEEFFPDDTWFQVSQIVATLVSGGVGRQSVKGSVNLNLSAIASSARKGDILVLEFKQVKRKNFKGDIENFNAYNKSMAIPLR